MNKTKAIHQAYRQEQAELDPAQLNRYSYVSGNPINSIDPLGLFDIPVAGNALDAAFAVSDLASVALSPGDSSNWLALAGDVAAAIVPTVPDGAGKLMKAGCGRRRRIDPRAGAALTHLQPSQIQYKQ